MLVRTLQEIALLRVLAHEGHLPALEVIDATLDLKRSCGDSVPHDLAVRQKLLDRVPNVQLDCKGDFVRKRVAAALCGGHLHRYCQTFQESFQTVRYIIPAPLLRQVRIHSCGHSTARRVPQHNEHLRLQMAHAVLHAANQAARCRTTDAACIPDHKQVTRVRIKNMVKRDPRVSTSENNGHWPLTLLHQ